MYLGKVETTRIVSERTPEFPLEVEYVIHQHAQMQDLTNPFRNAVGKLIPGLTSRDHIPGRFDYRYRNGVFEHFGAVPCNGGRQGIQLVTIRL